MKKTKKVKKGDKSQIALNVLDTPVPDYGDMAMRIYGQKTNEDRSMPDMYDGLKPVQRRVLQSFMDQGARFDRPPTKSARVVGHALGQYHPHGDTACYAAVVTMVNCSEPLAFGTGNWGDVLNDDDAAAMRYTNVRISRYAQLVFFDPRFWAVADKVPNYDAKDMEAYILPARLPNAIINGNSGIGIGITTDTPSFSLKSVIKLLLATLKNWKSKEPVTAAMCKGLEFHYPVYGGDVYFDDGWDEGFKTLIKKGEGEILFRSNMVFDRKAETVRIDRFANGLKLGKAIDKLREKPYFAGIEDLTGKGNEWPVYEVKLKVGDGSFKKIEDDLFDLFSESTHFKNNLTVREFDREVGKPGAIGFKRFSLVDFIQSWLERRIKLEVRVLTNQIKEINREIHRTKLFILAASKLRVILKILESKKGNYDAKLAKALKISVEDAKIILDLPVRRLSRLDGDEQRKRLKDLLKQRKELELMLKRPHRSVERDILELREQLLGKSKEN